MNEHTVLKNSLKMCFLGLFIFLIVSFITKDISYVFGFLLGYCINVLTFLVIIQSSTTILSLKSGSVGIVMMMFVVKLLLYSLGFFLTFKIDWLFNIVGVFVGYFVIKLTIYVDTYKNKGGELNG